VFLILSLLYPIAINFLLAPIFCISELENIFQTDFTDSEINVGAFMNGESPEIAIASSTSAAVAKDRFE
jgi:hypothetical protein